MKSLYLVLFIAFISSLSCTSPNILNQFIVDKKTYNTDHALLVLSEGPKYSNIFSLFISDKKLLVEPRISQPTSLNQGVILFIVLGKDMVNKQPIPTQKKYEISNASQIFYDIVGWKDTVEINGQSYGAITNATMHHAAPNVGTLTIHSIDLQDNTISCSYHFVDSDGIIIKGGYKGKLDISKKEGK